MDDAARLARAFAAPEISPDGTLTLEAFLARLLQIHPAFKAEEFGIAVATAERDASAAGEDWVFRANPSLGFEKPVSNSSFSPADARTLGVNASIERPYWNNGSRLGVDYNYNYVDQEVATVPIFGPSGQLEEFETGLPEFHQHALMLRYTLPLKRGRDGAAARLNLDRNEFALRSAKMRALETYEDLILRAAGRYIDWVLAETEWGIAQQREALARSQVGTVTRRFKQNRSARVDVLRAEANVAGARQRSLQAELQSKQIAQELSRMAYWTGREIQPAFDLFATNRVAALPAGDLGVRVLQLFDIEAERLARESRTLDDAVKPQLDLDLRGGLSGGDDTFGESAKLDQPDFRAGVVYRVPLGNRSAKKSQEANLLRAQQTQANREVLALELRTSIDSFQLQQRTLARMLELNDRQIGLAEKQENAEKQQWIQAKSPLTFVLQAQDAVAAAQVRKAQTAAAYQKVVLELRALFDALLPPNALPPR